MAHDHDADDFPDTSCEQCKANSRRFREHLERAKKIVESWPKWKRESFDKMNARYRREPEEK